MEQNGINTTIIKELDRLIVMGGLVSKQAARLKKKIAGGSSLPPKIESKADMSHMSLIAKRRKELIKRKTQCGQK
jgi:hypothetical protein